MRFPDRKWLSLLPVKALLIAVLFLLSAFAFGLLAHMVLQAREDLFDQHVHVFFLQHATPGLITAMERLTIFGSERFLLPAYIVLIAWYLVKKEFRYAITILVVALSSFLAMQGLKAVFHRHRPRLPVIKGITGYSFPSGHSLSSFIFCSILAYLLWQSDLPRVWKGVLTAGLFLLAVSIGISRIVLNVHYATDVIAGFCLGLMWVILSFWIIRKRSAGMAGGISGEAGSLL